MKERLIKMSLSIIAEVVMFPISAQFSIAEGLRTKRNPHRRRVFVNPLVSNMVQYGDTTLADRLGLWFFPKDEREEANKRIKDALDDYQRV